MLVKDIETRSGQLLTKSSGHHMVDHLVPSLIVVLVVIVVVIVIVAVIMVVIVEEVVVVIAENGPSRVRGRHPGRGRDRGLGRGRDRCQRDRLLNRFLFVCFCHVLRCELHDAEQCVGNGTVPYICY